MTWTFTSLLSQEEADTKLILHTQRLSKVAINSSAGDTGVHFFAYSLFLGLRVA